MPSVAPLKMTSDDSHDDRLARISRAAFLMVKGSIAEDLESRHELTEALQFAGFNPTQRSVRRHWSDSTHRLTFSQFCNITEIEPVPTQTSLISMFEKLDYDNVGYLSHEEFLLNMTTRGEKLSPNIVESLLANTEYNKDKKFFYKKYCQDIVDTNEKLAEMALEKLKKDEEEFMVNSQTYKVRRKSSSPAKSPTKSLSPTKSQSLSPLKSYSISPVTKSHPTSPTKSLSNIDSDDVVMGKQELNINLRSKGSFYFENDSIISHQYSVTVKKKGLHRIAVQSQPQYRNASNLVDVQLYLFDENKRYICRTDQVQAGYCSWEGELSPGKYTLIPFTTGAKLRKRSDTNDCKHVPLVEKSAKVKLTREFQNVLSDMFSKADLDCNGTLSRTEFNLFNWRTSGEEVSDEEWAVVVENFPLKNGELTLDGFLTLHQMEAEDNGGDETELKVTLHTMGYSDSLVQDESASFIVSVASSSPGSSLSVSALKSPGLLLDKTVTRCAMMTDSQPTKVKGAPSSVLVYKEVTDSRVTFVIQNKSENNVNIQMDLSRSSGIISNK